MIEGLHRAGVEFRSLSEDFNTATATGKLQLTMVLAFSEWWRNSIRERSVAGQAKARAEGRFPGRRPSLNERQREYIRAERSKGVSQRDLAKRLEVSRWTIQAGGQVAVGGLGVSTPTAGPREPRPYDPQRGLRCRLLKSPLLETNRLLLPDPPAQ